MNGFENENQIITKINSISFNNFSEDLKIALLKINNGLTPKITFARKIGGRAKPDLLIKLDHRNFYISLKKGSGNSVHQEKLETFIPFVKKLGAGIEIINAIRLFIWSDGTIDGTGDIENRRGLKEMSESFPNELKIVQSFFDNQKNTLIHRFLTTGIDDSFEKVTHLMYGDVNNIYVAKIEDVETYLSSNISNSSISIGKLSFQAWNIVKNGNPNTENRRGQIQLKWGGLKNDIFDI